MNERNIMAAIIAAGLIGRKDYGDISEFEDYSKMLAEESVEIAEKIMGCADEFWCEDIYRRKGDSCPEIGDGGIIATLSNGKKQSFGKTHAHLFRDEWDNREHPVIAKFRHLPAPAPSPNTQS